MKKLFCALAVGFSCVGYAQASQVDLDCTERVAAPSGSTSFTLRSKISITPYVLSKQNIQAGRASGAPLIMKLDSGDHNGGLLYVSDYQNGIAIGVHQSNLTNATPGQQMNLYQMSVTNNKLDPKPSRLDCRVASVR